MKRKFYLFISCILLSVGSSIVLQAMQEQQEACVRTLKTSAFIQLAKAIQEGKVDESIALHILPQELKQLLSELVTIDLTTAGYNPTIRKAETKLAQLAAPIKNAISKISCYLLNKPAIRTFNDLLMDALSQSDTNLVKDLFIIKKFDPNIQFKQTPHGPITPLSLVLSAPSLDPSLVRFLIQAGANIYITDRIGNTPLHIAAQKGNITLVELLLEKHADVNLQNLSDVTPLMKAVESNSPEIVKLLLDRGANPTLEDIDGKRAIDYSNNTTDPRIRALLTT